MFKRSFILGCSLSVLTALLPQGVSAMDPEDDNPGNFVFFRSPQSLDDSFTKEAPEENEENGVTIAKRFLNKLIHDPHTDPDIRRKAITELADFEDEDEAEAEAEMDEAKIHSLLVIALESPSAKERVEAACKLPFSVAERNEILLGMMNHEGTQWSYRFEALLGLPRDSQEQTNHAIHWLKSPHIPLEDRISLAEVLIKYHKDSQSEQGLEISEMSMLFLMEIAENTRLHPAARLAAVESMNPEKMEFYKGFLGLLSAKNFTPEDSLEVLEKLKNEFFKNPYAQEHLKGDILELLGEKSQDDSTPPVVSEAIFALINEILSGEITMPLFEPQEAAEEVSLDDLANRFIAEKMELGAQPFEIMEMLYDNDLNVGLKDLISAKLLSFLDM